MHKKLGKIITLFLFGFNLIFGNLTYAQAETVELSSEDYNYIISTLNSYGISKEKQSALIKKFQNGQLWDSMNNESEPLYVKLIKNEHYGNIERVAFYPDGSISITGEIELNNYKKTDEIANFQNPNGLKPGYFHGGTGYRSFKSSLIYHNTLIITASFLADYQLLQKNYDRIDSVYDAKLITRGGSYSNMRLTINKKVEDANGPAFATLSAMVKHFKWTQGNIWLRLYVGYDSAWDSYSF